VTADGANELNGEQVTVVTDRRIFVDVRLAGDAARERLEARQVGLESRELAEDGLGGGKHLKLE